MVTVSVRAGTREWMGLIALAIPCSLVSMNSNLLNLALPDLIADLRPSTAEVLWIADIYLFLVAGSLMTMGVLGDRFGRRRTLLLGAAGFGSASLLAALATSVPTLIAARAVLGIAGAALMPSTLSLIRSMFLDPRQRAVALSGWTASFAVGGIAGPVIGGVLLDLFSWRSIFLIAPPAMLALLVLGPVLLPEYRNPAPRRVDVVGALLSLAAVLAAVYGITHFAENGAAAAGLGAVVVGGALMAAFLHRERNRIDPMIDLTLFRRRTFSTLLAMNALAFAALYGTQLLIGQYLRDVLGRSALEAGLWTIPSAVGYLVGSVLGSAIVNRARPAIVMSGSMLVAAAGFAVLTVVDAGPGSLAAYVTGSVVFSIGLAPAYILTTEQAVAALPPERAGVAGAVLETVTNLGGAVGIAVLGSLAGIVSHASTSPSRQDAFVEGFRAVEVAGALALLVGAVLTLALLRRQ